MTYCEDLNRMLRFSVEALQKENADLKKTNLEILNKLEEVQSKLEVVFNEELKEY
tara:strand:+ start:2293 stop:2457 length:165 start_codon:yes stop_codon:yes gene_type:complete